MRGQLLRTAAAAVLARRGLLPRAVAVGVLAVRGLLSKTVAAVVLALALASACAPVASPVAPADPPVPGTVFYVADTTGIVRIGPDGTRTVAEGLGARLLALGDDGSLYAVVSDDLVVRARPDGTRVPLPFNGLSQITGLAVDQAGTVYVAMRSGGIRTMTAGGVEGKVAVAGLHYISALAVDDSGNLHAASVDMGRVVTRTAAGAQTTSYLPGLDSRVVALAVDANKYFYAVDRDTDEVIRFGQGIVRKPLLKPGTFAPESLAVAADGVYVTDIDNDRVVRLGVDGAYTPVVTGLAGVSALVARTVPSPPTKVKVAAGDGKVAVSWSGAKDSGGRPINHYIVTADPGGLGCTTKGESECSVAGLTNGVDYSFTVRASNTGNVVGASVPSVVSEIVRPVGPVKTPVTTAPSDLASGSSPSIGGPATAASVSGAPIPTVPVTAGPVPTEPVTTAPVPTAPVPTAPVPTAPVPTAPVTSRPVTTAPVPTTPIPTAPVPTVPVTSGPVTGAPVTLPPTTTPPTTPATGAPVPTVPVPTVPVPTVPVPAVPVPTASVTSAPVPTEPVTSAPVPTAPVTGAPSASPGVPATTPTTVPPTRRVPSAPSGVSARAGYSSITVSWNSASGATRYRAVAEPGPASCETTATSCVLGGAAGKPYTVSVFAFDETGAWAESDTTAAVTPIAPPVADEPPNSAPKLGTDGSATTRPGRSIVLSGNGYAAHSTVRISVYSEPVALGEVVADASGAFRVRVSVPDGLPAGSHALVAAGIDPSGVARAMRLDVTVVAAGEPLPVTGSSVLFTFVAGLVFVLSGVLLRRVSRSGGDAS
ncbi:fibronectin type III domain-containing protein [Actinoplanes sp. LDG1-06]|uniref:Fibronectin type III domain-containing protein n=1 Tax=Paractinoplanes ovalisporus TaxID=2810368 RepID=A0ABS2A2X8_9ACTN|nr:fibronectin type III domain-containing protein [Actinoplanes ovalisporus]MBM2614030.1 fibronectin type III domain-containing protein [Actinoplanes ovalisporus]